MWMAYLAGAADCVLLQAIIVLHPDLRQKGAHAACLHGALQALSGTGAKPGRCRRWALLSTVAPLG
jgi:hypothetical protein